MARGWRKGKYDLKNPDKYVGDKNKIVFRSSWEKYLMEKFDLNANILEWNSEDIVIRYLSPVDNKIHRYHVDFYIKYRKRDGSIVKEIIEVKPYKQTIPSKARKETARLNENLDYSINVAKWDAAVNWAKKRGMTFRILTEKEIFR